MIHINHQKFGNSALFKNERLSMTNHVWTPAEIAMLYAYALTSGNPPLRGRVYPFGNTPDNEYDILDKTALLYRQAQASEIYLQGVDEYRGKAGGDVDYSGFTKWKGTLLRKGIPEKVIQIIPAPSESVTHTGTEARDLILLAKKKGWSNITIVAPAFHMPRCLANAVSQAIKHQVRLKICCAPAIPYNWQRKVRYSQGELTSVPMIETLEGEVGRLGKHYGNALDLELPEQILHYLHRQCSIPA